MASASNGRILEPDAAAREAIRDGALLGLGSGIFFGSHHDDLLAFAETLSAEADGRAFLFSTSGTGYGLARGLGRDYHRKLRLILQRKGYAVVGEFACKGFDTYGLWGKLGGIAKGHPDDAELRNARAFVEVLTHSA